MKANAIIRIILFSIAIVVLLSILGVGIAAKHYMFDNDFSGEYTASSTGTADADTVRNISIEWAAGTITMRPADVTELTFTETCPEGTDPMVWIQSGDTLKVAYVSQDSIFHFGFSSHTTPSKDLLIEVPRGWSCGILDVQIAAADLNVDSMTIGKVDFDGASGSFNFVDCAVEAIDMDTASGDVKFCGTLNSLECDAASADCEIVLSNCPERIDMDMASGDLDLTLPEGCGFDARMDALSGRMDTDFEISKTSNGFVCGDGSCRIDISAMSGDLYIHKSTEAKKCDH